MEKKIDSFETVGQIWLASVAFTERQYFPIVSLYFPKPTYLKIFDSQLKWIVYSVNLKPVFFFWFKEIYVNSWLNLKVKQKNRK